MLAIGVLAIGVLAIGVLAIGVRPPICRSSPVRCPRPCLGVESQTSAPSKLGVHFVTKNRINTCLGVESQTSAP